MTPPAHPAPSRWFDSRVRVDMVRVHLGLSGVLNMIILAFLGHPWTSIFGSWGGLGRPFWGYGGGLGRVWRAAVAKGRLPLSRPPFFTDFGTQMVPRRLPK